MNKVFSAGSKLFLLLLLITFYVNSAFSQSEMMVIAHRGASADELENSLSAFKRAFELGADAIEMDIWKTTDDSLVVNGNPNASLLVGWTNVVKNVFNWNVTTNNRDPCPSGYVVATSGQYTTLASGSMVPRQRRTPNLPLEERL